MNRKAFESKVILPIMAATAIVSSGVVLKGYVDLKAETKNVQKNLAPNAIYIKTSQSYRANNLQTIAVNEDVDGDGTFESVLKFVNPFTQKAESLLIEKDGEKIRFRRYAVADGKISYLEE